MQPVRCASCTTTVLVAKNSATQTTIQWQAASSSCPQRRDLTVGDSCPALGETIARAYDDGVLVVADVG